MKNSMSKRSKSCFQRFKRQEVGIVKKCFKTYIALWGIAIVAFNVISFVVPDRDYSASFWIGYALITLVFIGNLICSYKVFRSIDATRLFYRVSVLSIGWCALAVTFVLGGISMLLSGIPYWVSVICAVIVLAVYLSAVIKAVTVGDLVGTVDMSVQQRTSVMRELLLRATEAKSLAHDERVRKDCDAVCDAIRYSDPVSSLELLDDENVILNKMSDLTMAVKSSEEEKVEKLSQEIIQLIVARNMRSKSLK